MGISDKLTRAANAGRRAYELGNKTNQRVKQAQALMGAAQTASAAHPGFGEDLKKLGQAVQALREQQPFTPRLNADGTRDENATASAAQELRGAVGEIRQQGVKVLRHPVARALIQPTPSEQAAAEKLKAAHQAPAPAPARTAEEKLILQLRKNTAGFVPVSLRACFQRPDLVDPATAKEVLKTVLDKLGKGVLLEDYTAALKDPGASDGFALEFNNGQLIGIIEYSSPDIDAIVAPWVRSGNPADIDAMFARFEQAVEAKKAAEAAQS